MADIQLVETPTVKKDQGRYYNRVRYWESMPAPGLPSGYDTFDGLFTESLDYVRSDADNPALSSAMARTGTYAIEFSDTYSGGTLYTPFAGFDIPSMHQDMSGSGYGYIAFDLYLNMTADPTSDANNDNIYLTAFLNPGTGLFTTPRRNIAWTVEHRIERNDWMAFHLPIQQGWDSGSFDITDVQVLTIYGGWTSSYSITETVEMYIDNLRIIPQSGPANMYRAKTVETAAVTAGTDNPLEKELNTRDLDNDTAEKLANDYLDRVSQTRETISDVSVNGIRDVNMKRQIPINLTRPLAYSGSYPLVSIKWRPLDSGDRTTFALGESEEDNREAIEEIASRLQALDAEGRLT